MESLIESRYLKWHPGVIKNVRKNYNLEKKERIEEAVKILYDWIQKQDHIIKKDFDKEYLERTLITCKGSVEKAKKQIDRLCTMKTLLPKFFSKSNILLELEDILELGYLVPLPQLTEDNYRVVLVKLNELKNLTSELLLQYFQYGIILVEYLKANDYTDGFIIINDYREVNIFDLVTKINTVELQQYISILIEGYGARVKFVTFFTDSKAIEILLKLVKQIVSEKIGKRLEVTRTLEGLHKTVNKKILPMEYGGNEKSYVKLQEELLEELVSEKHVEYMKMMSKARTDETRRHEGRFNEEYMGMPGSFRCLSVD